MLVAKDIEVTGIVEERAANRAKWARFAYVAPQDRRNAPKPPASEDAEPSVQPEPVEVVPPAPPVEIVAVSPPVAMVARAPDGGPTIAEVQAAFCVAFAEAGGDVERGQPYTMKHLKSARRPRQISWPRHVCMDLVRRIVPGPVNGRVSAPAIGKAFGGFDHTSVMHAVWRAPHHLAQDPALAAAHARVLAQFGATS